jgi:nitrogenase molybdenum-iron protein alpha/beta subunit
MARDPDDLSVRTTPTFKEGVLMTAGAIADASLVYCGGSCIDEQAHQSIAPHDLGQTLFLPGLSSRLVTTFTDRSMVPFGAERPIMECVETLVSVRRPPLLILAELAGLTIAGDDLASIARSVAERFDLVVVPATAKRQARDFRDAYAGVVEGIAHELPRRAFEGGTIGGRVTVIGYVYERREGDQDGNLAAITRLLRALGVEPTAPWLSGAGFADLAEAARSSLLVALPHGREAARILAGRSGARVVDTDLPVGLSGTAAWVRAVAEAAGVADRADAVIRRELAAVVPLVDRVASRFLAGRRVAVAATRDWLPGIARMLESDLGMEVGLAFERSRFPAAGAGDSPDVSPESRRFDPSRESLVRQVAREAARRGIDLVVGSSLELHALASGVERLPSVEFGFPSTTKHFLTPAPHLGFEGVVTWAERLTTALLERG